MSNDLDLEQYSIRIRTAEASDAKHVITIRSRAFKEHAPKAYTKKQVQTLLEDYEESEFIDMINKSQLFVAVTSNDVVIASSGWEDGKIRHCYVDPQYTGNGIGRQIVSYAERDLIERTDLEEIKLGAALYARDFYRKLGFETVQKSIAWDGSQYYEGSRRK